MTCPTAVPADPPVPAALLAFAEGPTPDQLVAARAHEEKALALAAEKGCPDHILERGVGIVRNCHPFYVAIGRWPTRVEVDRCSGPHTDGSFRVYDRKTSDPQRRVANIFKGGRWDARAAERRNRLIYGDYPLPRSGAAIVQSAPQSPQARARGVGKPAVRGASKRSSARSGDSGSDDSSEPEPEPHQAPECRWCGRDISHLRTGAKHCSPTHRVYANRARAAKRRRRAVVQEANNRLHPLGKYTVQTQAEYEALRRRVDAGCRCNGHHISERDHGREHCIKCGHDREASTRGRGVAA